MLDDVDCFDTLKSQTCQWHGFMTLLFQRSRSFQSCSEACFLPKSIFVRRHRTRTHSDIVLLPSCGHRGTTQDPLGALLRHCRKWHFYCKNNMNRHIFPTIISRSFKVVLMSASYQSAFFVRRHRSKSISTIVSYPLWVSTMTMLKPPRGRPQKVKLCDVVEREPLFFCKDMKPISAWL